MTQRVVDHLETVEVDEQDRAFAIVAASRLDGVVKKLVEHGTVQEAGQSIMRGEILYPALRLPVPLLDRSSLARRQRFRQDGQVGRPNRV
jgi:hypothetical protein